MTFRMSQVGRNSGDEECVSRDAEQNSNSVQKSGAEDDIVNTAGGNSRDAERVENSNSVQKSGAEDDIVNATGRNSRDAEGLKTVIQFKRVELKMTL